MDIDKMSIDDILKRLNEKVVAEAKEIIDFVSNIDVSKSSFDEMVNLEFLALAQVKNKATLYDEESLVNIPLFHKGKDFSPVGIYIIIVGERFEIDRLDFNYAYETIVRTANLRKKISSHNKVIMKKNDVFYIGTSKYVRKRLQTHINWGKTKNPNYGALRLGLEKRNYIKDKLYVFTFQLLAKYKDYYKQLCETTESILHDNLTVKGGLK